ncbi:MAG TPA: helix-turn-helix domain-containing protein, partial [Anaeromyxobacteraceae bacterium]|nr:helix-turn-helix domain-containing protein [Anaeromyxobacteraceae bacterium]
GLILAGEGEIEAGHLGGSLPGGGRGRRVAELLEDGFELDAFERELILAALEKAGGNKTHAARFLGVTRRRLYSLLASLGAGEEPGEGGGEG